MGEKLHVQAEKIQSTCRAAGNKLSFLPAKTLRLLCVEMQPHKEKQQILGIQLVSSGFLQACHCGPSLFGLGLFLFVSTREGYLEKNWQKGAELWTAVFHTKMSVLYLESAQRRLELLLITLQQHADALCQVKKKEQPTKKAHTPLKWTWSWCQNTES